MSEPEISQQYCVRWNSHLPSLSTAFPQLLNQQRFIDVTLACEGQQVHCHKIVLAACSAWFDSLLAENPCKHPIIILPKDIKFWTVQALVEFMYKGQVNVSQAGLPDLVKTGDLLQIRGLCNTDITSGLAAPSNLQPIENPKKYSNATEDTCKEINSSKEDDKTNSDKLKSDDELDKTEREDTEANDQMEMDEAKDRALEPIDTSDTGQQNEIVAGSSVVPGDSTFSNCNNSNNTDISTVGQIRVKPIENLFENYNKGADIQPQQAKQITETVIIDIDDPHADYDGDELIATDSLPPSLHYNRNIMDISIRPKLKRTSSGSNFTFGPKQFESNKSGSVSEIVCIPSMEEFEGIDQMEEGDDDEILCLPDYDPCSIKPPPLLSFSEQNQQLLNRSSTNYQKILPKPNFNNGHTLEDTERKVMKGLMLRSPRGNQPRTYTQDELFQALNAIKAGLSIYRASQRYKVPRKTLRNWMKRWQIKSVYPMPAQLQRAAEKKKEQRDQILANISVFQENPTSQIENHIS